jgi:formylglycine-generating enzyme required for sulfatase activity
MVYVPEGQFRIHEGREVRKVRSFFIDRCEVTNAEYAKFLDEVERNGDAGYCHPRQPARKDHTPAQWGDPIFNAPELPVVGVDWFDAYAFATWAKKRLPTDEEWEAAARGVEGRIFPWGDRWERSLANTPDRFLVYELWGWATVDWAGWVPSAAARDAFIKLSAATPAGAFLRDQSPFGCLDMAGNVEEWVADWFGAESSAGGGPASGGGVPAAPGADTAICGVRGGSWVYGGLQRPLSFRTGAEPLARATYRGFRCAK